MPEQELPDADVLAAIASQSGAVVVPKGEDVKEACKRLCGRKLLRSHVVSQSRRLAVGYSTTAAGRKALAAPERTEPHAS